MKINTEGQQTRKGKMRQGTGRFAPRARILRTIGADLISSEVVAVIELVRNCYDADAETVKIRLWTPDGDDGGVLEVEDDGHGISREVLLGPWLEPATDHKLGPGLSDGSGAVSPGGRRRLGSKGVGRFAAQKLGEVLKIVSRTPDSRNELEATFNWAEFERESGFLHEIEIPWEEKPAERLKAGHGTLLEISGLTDEWSEGLLEMLRVGLSRLVSPEVGQDKFRIEFYLNGAVGEVIQPAIDHIAPMYSIKGEIDVGGKCEIQYSDVSGAEENWARTVSWHSETQNCGPFRFAINAWDLDREALEPFLEQIGSQAGLRDFRRLIRQHSGINLYRDGFRILPYGEPDNDWLRLDRRRVNNPTLRLSNNQVFGAIHLGATSNPELIDQTNREGLISNDAYRHLREIVLDLLGYLETRRFKSRRERGISGSRNGSGVGFPTLTGSEILIRQIGDIDNSNGGRKKLQEIRSIMDEWSRKTADSIRTYASLASRGQMSGLVFSQIDHPIRRISAELRNIDADFRAGVENEKDVQTMHARILEVRRSVALLEQTVRKMDPIAIDRRMVRPERANLREVVDGVIAAFESEFDRRGVVIDSDLPGDLQVRMVVPVFQNAFSMVFDNAIYWASKGPGRAPKVVRVLPVEFGCQILNNGPPILKKQRDLVFEPHYTTRTDRPGLGLALARDLMMSTGGDVRAVDSRSWTTFEINFGNPGKPIKRCMD